MVDNLLRETHHTAARRVRRGQATLRNLHGWAGAGVSLILVVIAITGSLLVFKDDYIRMTVPEARQSVNLSLSALAQVTEIAEKTFGPDQLRALVYGTQDFGLHKAYLTEHRAAYLSSDGTVIAEWEQNGRLEDWLFDLHHRLLTGTVGLYVAGFTGIAGLVLIITGLIAVWPMRRGWRRGLKIRSTSRGQLLSVHRNLGTFVAAPLMVSIATGVMMTFPNQTRAVFDQFGSPEPVDAPTFTAGKTDWLNALSQAETAFPDATPRMALWGRNDRPSSIRLKQAQEWHPNGRTLVVIDPGTGALLGRNDALKNGVGREAYNAVYPIHAAHIGGRIYDTIVFLTGLALMVLGLFGLLAFSRRFIRH